LLEIQPGGNNQFCAAESVRSGHMERYRSVRKMAVEGEIPVYRIGSRSNIVVPVF
jgi:hypothetical protein